MLMEKKGFFFLTINFFLFKGELPRMQKELKMVKDEDVHFSLGVKRAPSFPHGLQPVVSRGKAPPGHPFPEALRGPFSQFRYEPPPGELDGFPGCLKEEGHANARACPPRCGAAREGAELWGRCWLGQAALSGNDRAWSQGAQWVS